MFEIAGRLLAALDSLHPLAVATAVSIEGSSPRTVGTSMAYDGERVIGSIAGGCVEAAVVGVCEEVLADGHPRLVEYGISDETAFEVGLSCGGRLRIVAQRVTADSPLVHQLRAAAAGDAAGIATVLPAELPALLPAVPASVAGQSPLAESSARRIAAELAARVASGTTRLSTIECEDQTFEVFFEVSVPPPRMIIVGAMEPSSALAAASVPLGFRVTVVDPRSLFATRERFPGAEVVVSWPVAYLDGTVVDDRTVICVLGHDDRYDTDVVEFALGLGVGYVGAMGSRRTSDRRFAALRERGVADDALARLHSPIGLDLGASTPEETAVSILADVLTTRTSATAMPLRATRGPIHRSTALPSEMPSEMTSDIAIRAAAPGDVDFLAAMLLEAANWRGDDHSLSPESLRREPSLWHYLDGWQRPTDFGVVALDTAGHPAGAAWARILPATDPGYGFVSELIPEIGMAVAARFRSRGIGGLLLRSLMEAAVERGYSALSLSVERGNERARRLYENLGFVVVDRVGNSDTMLVGLARPEMPNGSLPAVRSLV